MSRGAQVALDRARAVALLLKASGELLEDRRERARRDELREPAPAGEVPAGSRHAPQHCTTESAGTMATPPRCPSVTAYVTLSVRLSIDVTAAGPEPQQVP